jgi:histone acetyltransferase (RNA polymerase elongator complex component)
MIIPFFIPHSGCPHQCVFCNQKNITGQDRPPDISSLPQKINKFLKTNTGNKPVQIAFYGGSFTALPVEMQKAYLEAAQPFVKSGQVESVRLSTRPDAINRDILSFLEGYRVNTIELGAQSMDDRVLALSGRGHTVADTVNAVELIKGRGLTLGLQLMPGLPGDSSDTFLETVAKSIALKPDFVRLYPVLVIKGTPLEELYKAGKYTPLSLHEAIAQCRAALVQFGQAGIDVIRVGLQPTEELGKPGTVVAGPYHPAFRQLVESSLLLDAMRAALGREGAGTPVTLHVNTADLSSAIGQKRCNVTLLKSESGLASLAIVPDILVPRGSVRVEKSASVNTGNML